MTLADGFGQQTSVRCGLALARRVRLHVELDLHIVGNNLDRFGDAVPLQAVIEAVDLERTLNADPLSALAALDRTDQLEGNLDLLCDVADREIAHQCQLIAA